MKNKLALVLAMTVISTSAFAQTAVPENIYERANARLAEQVTPLLDNAVLDTRWQDGTLLYRKQDQGKISVFEWKQGSKSEIELVNLDKLSSALDQYKIKPDQVQKLPLSGYEFKSDAVTVKLGKETFVCELKSQYQCSKQDIKKKEPGVLSPDKRMEAFIRNWNLWVRDVETGKEQQLTTDGVEDYGYATDNAGWKHTDQAILVWSPDSKKIATFQQDQRKTGEMYMLKTQVGRPELERWKYPLVGDEHVTMIERVVIDVAGKNVVRLKMPPDQHRSTLCDDVSCSGGWEDVQWAHDSSDLVFASTSRDHKHTWVRRANINTGEVSDIFEENVATYFESGITDVSWRYLSKSNEILWFSERKNWGNLYLYDAKTGALKRAVTSGEWNVAEISRIDEDARTLWVVGVGKETQRNPYYKHVYQVNLETGAATLLTREDADHAVKFPDQGDYFLDSYSTISEAPITVIRSIKDGAVLQELGRTDLARAKKAGWRAPEMITVKARDKTTELYGLLYKPSDFDPNKRYPVINYIYPGPQTGSVRSFGFMPAQGDNQALAELGFIVIAINGMGTPWRSKAFHDAYFGNIGDNTLPDQITAMEQLAQKHAWIDLDRAGIWGHSGGGNATAGAMFRYPDFFKVGIAESGNHDNRNYEDDWAEKWQGLLVKNNDGTTNYDDQANQNHAHKLKGKLFLIHGTLDDNVPPDNTLLVVDALIKANKDFDLLMIPNARHAYGDKNPYVIRRRWDYFVEHLLNMQPPREFKVK